MTSEELIAEAGRLGDWPNGPPSFDEDWLAGFAKELASRLEALREATQRLSEEVIPLCEEGQCHDCDAFRKELSR
jgi:hypothetical protein